MRRTLLQLGSCLLLLAAATGCTDPDFAAVDCGDFSASVCVRIPGGDSAALLDAVQTLEPGTAVILGLGTYELDNQVTIRSGQITLAGQGMDATVLSFGTAEGQINGIDAVSDGFLVQDLTVLDANKDGIRVEDSDGVTFRRIKATWTNEGDSTNGAYGIYPVRCQNVLVEDSVAENASDAGLYVGQCQNVIVRNNTVTGNVAGLEIENTQYADVFGNTASNNTAGIVVFDLPGNPIVGHDVRLRDNTITNNNHSNFAPGGTVAVLPAGTGTFALASRRVEITNNVYMNNGSADIAILNGLVVADDPAVWDLDTSMLVGDWMDLGLPPGTTAGTISNARSENIVISGNTHMGSGTAADPTKEFGVLLLATFGSDPVASIIYDTIGESMFNPDDAAMNSNDNHICAGGNTGGTGFASLNVPTQLVSIGSPILHLETAPFAPFDCTELTGGPVAAVTLP